MKQGGEYTGPVVPKAVRTSKFAYSNMMAAKLRNKVQENKNTGGAETFHNILFKEVQLAKHYSQVF